MIRFTPLIVVAATAAAPVSAQQTAPAATPAQYVPPPRARAPGFDLSLEAARTAIDTCIAKGFHATALVTDSAGVPVVLLSADGATPIGVDFAQKKAAAAIVYKQPSGEVAARAKADPAFAAEVKANPKIGFAMPGAFPMIAGGEQIGAIAVSGAAGPEMDTECATAGLDKVAARLR